MKFLSLIIAFLGTAVYSWEYEAPAPSPVQSIPPAPHEMLPKYAMSCDWKAIQSEVTDFPHPPLNGTSDWQAPYSCCTYANVAGPGEAQESWFSTKEACAEKCGCKGFYKKGTFSGNWINEFCVPQNNNWYDRRLESKKSEKPKKPKSKKSLTLNPERDNGPPCSGHFDTDKAWKACRASSPCFNLKGQDKKKYKKCQRKCEQQQQWAEYENSGVKFRKPKPAYAPEEAPSPVISDIGSASTDPDRDCRDDAATTCYTAGVLSTNPNNYYYGDREYVMTEIPDFLNDMNFVRTANDDKRSNANDEFLCFNVDADATVYVLYDSRASSRPGWLSADYTNLPAQAAITTDTDMVNGFDIYYAEVSAGQVCMGGNGKKQQTGAGSMYVVVVGPAGAQDPKAMQDNIYMKYSD